MFSANKPRRIGQAGKKTNRDGRGRGRGNRPGSGPGGNCVCPDCGAVLPHKLGVRCMDIDCPQCGTKMIKE